MANRIWRLITSLLGKHICSTPVRVMFLNPRDENNSPLLHLHPRAVPGVAFTGCSHQPAPFSREGMETCRSPFRILFLYLRKKRRKESNCSSKHATRARESKAFLHHLNWLHQGSYPCHLRMHTDIALSQSKALPKVNVEPTESACRYPERRSRFSRGDHILLQHTSWHRCDSPTFTTKTLTPQHPLPMLRAHTRRAFLIKNTWCGLCSRSFPQIDKSSIYVTPKTTARPC